MSSLGEKDWNKQVISLAKKVAEAKDRDIPRLLFELKDILEATKDKGKKALQVKQCVWEYELLDVICLTLEQDFSKLDGQWDTAAKLINILSECCVGLKPTENEEEFTNEYLPNAIESILLVARKAQARYVKMSKVLEDRKKALFTCFKSIMESLILLMSGHEDLAMTILKSTSFIQLLMTEDTDMVLLVLSTLQSANRMKEGVFSTLSQKTIQSFLDEIIYKLSSTEEENIASSATHSLLIICDSHPPIVELLCSRYKGLGPLLKKWTKKGFDRDLRRLSVLLDAGSMQQAEDKKFHQAAKVLQAWWRSHYTRRKLSRANTAIAKFQRSFRSRKELEQQQKEDEKQRTELEHLLQMRRKRAMRQLHQKRLQTIEILAPAEVDKHLAKEQQLAALCIQKTWRGWRTRQQYDNNKLRKRQTEAAIRIQRSVRRWLKKVQAKRREPPNWQRPPGLTDERRVELQQHINAWRDSHVIQATTDEEREALHEKVQNLLKREAMMSRNTRKAQQRREALLAQLEVDSKLILGGPKLSEVTNKDLEMYSCFSVPVRARARYNHTQELRLLKQPWWKKLGDEYQDEKVDEELNWKVL